MMENRNRYSLAFIRLAAVVFLFCADVGQSQFSADSLDINCIYDRSGAVATAYCWYANSTDVPRSPHYSKPTIQELSCDLSLESIAVLTYSIRNNDLIIDGNCSSPPIEIFFSQPNEASLRIICEESKLITIPSANAALQILDINFSREQTLCEFLKLAAAAWSLGVVLSDEYIYRCGSNQYDSVAMARGQSVTLTHCSSSNFEKCLSLTSVWRIEIEWTSDDNVDLAILQPPDVAVGPYCSNVGGSTPKVCESNENSLTGGKWFLTMGPDDTTGADGGLETAEIRLEGVPEESRFIIAVVLESAPFNVTVTVKYFLNDVEVVTVTPNIAAADAQTSNAWGGNSAKIDVFYFTATADPNSFSAVVLT